MEPCLNCGHVLGAVLFPTFPCVDAVDFAIILHHVLDGPDRAAALERTDLKEFLPSWQHRG